MLNMNAQYDLMLNLFSNSHGAGNITLSRSSKTFISVLVVQVLRNTRRPDRPSMIRTLLISEPHKQSLAACDPSRNNTHRSSDSCPVVCTSSFSNLDTHSCLRLCIRNQAVAADMQLPPCRCLVYNIVVLCQRAAKRCQRSFAHLQTTSEPLASSM